jgi:hypothetical protein
LVRPDGSVEAWGFWRVGGMEMDWVRVDMERSGEKGGRGRGEVGLYRKGQKAGRESEVRWEGECGWPDMRLQGAPTRTHQYFRGLKDLTTKLSRCCPHVMDQTTATQYQELGGGSS